MIHKRSCKVKDNGGKLKLRVVIDRFSAEVFANDGEQVTVSYTHLSMLGIITATSPVFFVFNPRA